MEIDDSVRSVTSSPSCNIPEDEVLALEVLGVGAHLADGPLEALLALEGVEVDVEDALNLVVELVHEGGLLGLGAEGPSGGEGEGEGGQQQEQTAEDQQGQDDGSEDVEVAGGSAGLAVLLDGVVVVIEVALRAAVVGGGGGGGGVGGGRVAGLGHGALALLDGGGAGHAHQSHEQDLGHHLREGRERFRIRANAVTRRCMPKTLQ